MADEFDVHLHAHLHRIRTRSTVMGWLVAQHLNLDAEAERAGAQAAYDFDLATERLRRDGGVVPGDVEVICEGLLAMAPKEEPDA